MNITQTDTTQRVAQIETFINRIFEGSTGFITIWTKPTREGGITQNKFFNATTERDKAINYVISKMNQDVWCSIATSINGERGNEFVKDRRWIIGDADNKKTYGHLDFLKITPTMVVQSSPGKFHIYYDMGEVWDNDDIYEMNKAFIDAHTLPFAKDDKQLDTAAKDPMRLLRIPGTLHTKDPDNPQVVQILEDNGSIVDVHEFTRVYPPFVKTTGSGTNSHERTHDTKMCSKVRNVLNDQIRKAHYDRHPGAVNGGVALIHLGREGHMGWRAALDIFLEEVVRELETNGRDGAPGDYEAEILDGDNSVAKWLDKVMDEFEEFPEPGTGCDGRSCKQVDSYTAPQYSVEQQVQINGGNARLVFDASNEPRLLEEVKDAIGTGSLDMLFLHAGKIRRTVRRIEQGQERVVLVDINHDRLYAILNEHCSFYVWKEDAMGNEYQSPVIFPAKLTKALLGVEDELSTRNLRIVEGFSSYPVITKDGRVFSSKGYHEEIQTLITRNTDVDIPDVVTKKDVDDALEFILGRVLHDFPWARKEDKINYLGLLLTPLLREVCPRHTYNVKAFAIDSKNAGTGKGYLDRISGSLYGQAMVTMSKDDEEVRKKLTSVLVNTTETMLSFDNVRGSIDSTSLESALTATQYSDRILGSNEMVYVTNDRVMVLNGNNLDFNGDMARRLVWVKLAPTSSTMHNKDSQSFKYDLSNKVATDEFRVKMISALLTLIRFWIQQGSKKVQASSDSFGVWGSVIRGITTACGIEEVFDPFEDQQQFMGSKNSSEYEFVKTLFELSGGKNFNSKQICDWLDSGPSHGAFDGHAPKNELTEDGMSLLAAVAPSFIVKEYEAAQNQGKIQGFKKWVTAWVKNRDGRWFGEYQLTFKVAGSNVRFKVVKGEGSAPVVEEAPAPTHTVALDSDGLVAPTKENLALGRSYVENGDTMHFVPLNGEWNDVVTPTTALGFIAIDANGNVLDSSIVIRAQIDENEWARVTS